MNLWSNEVLTDSSASLPDNKNLVIRRMTGTRDVHVVYCADKKKSKHYRHYHEMLFYRLCWGIGRVTSQCMAFSCLFLICDKSASVLHSSRDPLINIYAYMDTHTHTPFLQTIFSSFLMVSLISVLSERPQILSMLLLFLSQELHTDSTAASQVLAVPPGCRAIKPIRGW